MIPHTSFLSATAAMPHSQYATYYISRRAALSRLVITSSVVGSLILQKNALPPRTCMITPSHTKGIKYRRESPIIQDQFTSILLCLRRHWIRRDICWSKTSGREGRIVSTTLVSWTLTPSLTRTSRWRSVSRRHRRRRRRNTWRIESGNATTSLP